MADLIGCRNCDSHDCKGCNVYTLATMLQAGKFDCLMDGHHSIAIAPSTLRPKGEWISVEDRLPESAEAVLVHGKYGGIYTAKLIKDYGTPIWHKLNSKNHYCNPTHWMPLPEPPRGEA